MAITIKEVFGNEHEGYTLWFNDDEADVYTAMNLWIDNKYNDIECEWTEYIFYIDNDKDMKVAEYQEMCDDYGVSINFDKVSSYCLEWLEEQGSITQDDNGGWQYA